MEYGSNLIRTSDLRNDLWLPNVHPACFQLHHTAADFVDYPGFDPLRKEWIKMRPFQLSGSREFEADTSTISELVTGIASSSSKYWGKAHVQSSKSKKWQPGGSSSSNLIWTSDLEVIVQYEVMNHQEIPRALPTAPCRCIIHWLQLSETFGRTLYLRSED